MKAIIVGILAASTALAFNYDDWGDYSWGEDNELSLNLSLDGNDWNGNDWNGNKRQGLEFNFGKNAQNFGGMYGQSNGNYGGWGGINYASDNYGTNGYGGLRHGGRVNKGHGVYGNDVRNVN